MTLGYAIITPMPVPGQPGLYRLGAGGGYAPMPLPEGGFGAAPVPRPVLPKGIKLYTGSKPPKLSGFGALGDADAVRALLATADVRFGAVKQAATRVLPASIFGPIDRSVIDRIRAQVAGKGPGWYASIGAAEFAGLIHFFLSSVAYNLTLVHALMNGPDAEAQTVNAVLILTPANLILDGLSRLISTAQMTEDAITELVRRTDGAAQSIGRQLGLAGLALPPLAVIAIVFVVAVVIAYLFSQWASMQAASDAADRACAAPGATCTPGQWAEIRDQALQAASSLSIFTNLGRAIEDAGHGASSAIFWGGLLGIGALVAYGVWVTAPAAQVARGRLTARASTL